MDPLSLQKISFRLADIAPYLRSTSHGTFRQVGHDTNIFILGGSHLTLSARAQESLGYPSCNEIFVQKLNGYRCSLGLEEGLRTFQSERFNGLASDKLMVLIELNSIVAEAALQQIDQMEDIHDYLKLASTRTLIAAMLFKKIGEQICVTEKGSPDKKVNPKILRLYKAADRLTGVLEEFVEGLSDHDPEVLHRLHTCERALCKLLSKHARKLKIDIVSVEDNRHFELNQDELSRACEEGKYKTLSTNELLLLGFVYLVAANFQITNAQTLFDADDYIEEATDFVSYADSFVTGAQYMFYLASEKIEKEIAQNN